MLRCHDGDLNESLSALMAEANRFAHFTMKRDGYIAPLLMASTEEAVLMYSPKNVNDEPGKDSFANTIRLIASSYAVSAVVLIMESWMTRASPEGKLDETPPSESYDREEVVILVGQSREENCTRMYPIVRLDNGKFWNLGDPFDLGANEFSGRFADLMPPKEVDPTMRELGKTLLKSIGVELILIPKRPLGS